MTSALSLKLLPRATLGLAIAGLLSVDGRAKTKTEDKDQIPDKLAATAARLKADNQVAVLSSTRVTAFGHVISPNGFN